MGPHHPRVRKPLLDADHRMNNRITSTVVRVDAAKELEYSRLPIARTESQATTQPATGIATAPATRPSQTTAPVLRPQQPQQPQLPQQPQQSTSQLPAQQRTGALSDGQFIVQVASGGTLDLKNPNFVKITTQLGLEVKYKLIDGKYKYYVGFFSTQTDAKDIAAQLDKMGIKGAWVRAKY
jgi:hypothetical protein